MNHTQKVHTNSAKLNMEDANQGGYGQQSDQPDDQHPIITRSSSDTENRSPEKKNPRKIWARNAVITLFTIGGFVGLTILIAVTMCILLRQPKRSCSDSNIGFNQSYCNQNLFSEDIVLDDTEIVLLLEGCIILALTAIGIAGAIKYKSKIVIMVSVGYGLCFIILLAVCGIAVERHENTKYYSPYVPSTVQNQLRDTLLTSLKKYSTDSGYKAFWQDLQGKYCCCGIDGHEDWEKLAGLELPQICYCKCSQNQDKCSYYRCPVENSYYYYGRECSPAVNGPYGNSSVSASGCIKPILSSVGRHRKTIVVAINSILIVIAFVLIAPAMSSVCSLCCLHCCKGDNQPRIYYQPGQHNQPVMIMVPMQGQSAVQGNA